MKTYKNILVAIDLNPSDDCPVTEHAMSIAKDTGANVSFIHVVEPVYNYGVPLGAGYKIDEWEEELEKAAQHKLTELGKKYKISAEHLFLKIGFPRNQIVKIANDKKIDLIVVGSHARHGIKALIMGDTAEDMIADAKCDVLTVHVPNG